MVMYTKWSSVGADLGVGAVAGVLDQIVQNQDNKRGVKYLATLPAGTNPPANGKMPIMRQYGTYYNYGIPIVAIGLTAFGMLKDDMATRLLTVGGELAGRKITHQLSTGSSADVSIRSAAYTQWRQQAAMEAARTAADEINPTLPSQTARETIG